MTNRVEGESEMSEMAEVATTNPAAERMKFTVTAHPPLPRVRQYRGWAPCDHGKTEAAARSLAERFSLERTLIILCMFWLAKVEFVGDQWFGLAVSVPAFLTGRDGAERNWSMFIQADSAFLAAAEALRVLEERFPESQAIDEYRDWRTGESP